MKNPVVMRFIGFCPIITQASIRLTIPVAFIYELLLLFEFTILFCADKEFLCKEKGGRIQRIRIKIKPLALQIPIIISVKQGYLYLI